MLLCGMSIRLEDITTNHALPRPRHGGASYVTATDSGHTAHGLFRGLAVVIQKLGGAVGLGIVQLERYLHNQCLCGEPGCCGVVSSAN
jgi:hypothetical protein